MKPESSLLLRDLTASGPDGVDGEYLIRALRVRLRRQAVLRTAALCMPAAAGLCILAARLLPGKESPPALPPVALTVPPVPEAAPPSGAKPLKLNGEELLDSFPDQPVALVTWPDGRQQLLAITPRTQTARKGM